MQVDCIHIYENGNIMWKGKITNVINSSLTITQSKSISLAAIVLSERYFTLEIH